MTLLRQTIEAYAFAKDVQPERYRVECLPAQRFSFALNSLARTLGDDADSPFWELLLSSARAARWRAGAEGIPFDVPSSGAEEPLRVLVERATSLSDLTEGPSQRLLRQLHDTAIDMLTENNETLSLAVTQCLSDGDPNDTCAVASNGRTAGAISAWLSTQGIKVPVMKPRDFMTGRRWDFAVVVGAADWFPGQMFTCPHAEALTLVHYAHLSDSAQVEGIFGRFATLPLAVRIRDPRPWSGKAPTFEQVDAGADEADGAATQSPQPNWLALTQHLPQGEESEEQVNARLVVLGAGYGMWLPVDAVSIRGLDLSAAPGERVIVLKTLSITSDSVLVVREEGSVSGTLVTMANAILGTRAGPIRRRQQEWKSLLRVELRRIGAVAVERAIRKAGSSTANLRFWSGDENIRPQSDHDFRVLLTYLGVSDPDPYLQDGRELWRAHHRAGLELSNALEAALETANLTELEARGRQQFQLDNNALKATLTAFRVVAVQKEVHVVPAGATRRSFNLGGAKWLE